MAEQSPKTNKQGQNSMEIVIFGTGQIAELANFYFENDSPHSVVGFTVDREFLQDETYCGRPVVPFDEVEEQLPPAAHQMFIAVSYASVNKIRAEKAEAARRMGYTLASYVSSRATVFPGFEPGDNCFILEDNTIQPFARIGNNVTLWSGNHVGHHSTIGDDVFITSHVVISGGVTIGTRSFIGVNATLRNHISVGQEVVVGAGALLLEDAPDRAVYAAAGTEKSRVPSNRLRTL